MIQPSPANKPGYWEPVFEASPEALLLIDSFKDGTDTITVVDGFLELGLKKAEIATAVGAHDPETVGDWRSGEALPTKRQDRLVGVLRHASRLLLMRTGEVETTKAFLRAEHEQLGKRSIIDTMATAERDALVVVTAYAISLFSSDQKD